MKNSKLQSCRSRRELQFSYKFHLHLMSYLRVMIFQRFFLITSLLVARQNNTVTPTGVVWQHFPYRKRCLTWRMLPHQCMWRDNIIWSRQRYQKGQIRKFLGAVIIKILNKKGLKIKKIPHSGRIMNAQTSSSEVSKQTIQGDPWSWCLWTSMLGGHEVQGPTLRKPSQRRSGCRSHCVLCNDGG
jgi:hypothetical protein